MPTSLNQRQARKLLKLADALAYQESVLGFEQGRADMNADDQMGDALDKSIVKANRRVVTARLRLVAYLAGLAGVHPALLLVGGSK